MMRRGSSALGQGGRLPRSMRCAAGDPCAAMASLRNHGEDVVVAYSAADRAGRAAGGKRSGGAAAATKVVA